MDRFVSSRIDLPEEQEPEIRMINFWNLLYLYLYLISISLIIFLIEKFSFNWKERKKMKKKLVWKIVVPQQIN